MNPETARSQDPSPEILPSYQEIQNESLQILNSECNTIVHVFQAHCNTCHYIGWNFRIMVLLLAWKYGQGELVQQECITCYLYFCVVLEIDQQIITLNEEAAITHTPPNAPQ